MASSQDNALEGRVLPNHAFLGREYRRESDGTYLQNWNPLLLACDLRAGEIVGKDFLGTRVIVYRGPDGRPVVQSAYCPHVGADLSLGKLVDGNIRCAYHHWKFSRMDDASTFPRQIASRRPRASITIRLRSGGA